MNVLIFGGTGLLGSAAAQIFIDRGHHVKTTAPAAGRRTYSQGNGDRIWQLPGAVR